MSWHTILLWVLILGLSILFLAFYHATHPSKTTTHSITTDAVFFAIIFIMGFIPQMGYIAIVPGVSLTLMHLPILLGAYLFGWKRGLLYGIAFGVTSWLQAMMSGTGFNAFFIYPWISILPRALWGFLAGLFFQLLRKLPKIYGNAAVIAAGGLLLTVLHTGLVFGALFLFFPKVMVPMFTSSEPAGAGIAFTFLACILLGMAGESALGAIVTPALGLSVRKISERTKH